MGNDSAIFLNFIIVLQSAIGSSKISILLGVDRSLPMQESLPVRRDEINGGLPNVTGLRALFTLLGTPTRPIAVAPNRTDRPPCSSAADVVSP